MQAKKWKLARGFAYPVIDVLCAPFGHCFLCKHVLEFHCTAALFGSWEADDDTIDLEERRKKIRSLCKRLQKNPLEQVVVVAVAVVRVPRVR